MESKLRRSSAPPAKRVARQRVGFEYSALRQWKMNWSGDQPRLESVGYRKVLISNITSSAKLLQKLSLYLYKYDNNYDKKHYNDGIRAYLNIHLLTDNTFYKTYNWERYHTS